MGLFISIPAVMPDLTVLENVQVALPRHVFPSDVSDREFVQSLLTTVHLKVPLGERVQDLTVASKHLLEIAKALALKPTSADFGRADSGTWPRTQ